MIVTVKHNFETAHRLPFLPGKCQSLHGHSWWVELLYQYDMDANGLTLEYGELKKKIRTWIDLRLDHGTMLGVDDELVKYRDLLGKTFVFGTDDFPWLPWPTVEAVAQMISDYAPYGQRLMEVRVQETHVNSAVWRR